MKVKELIDLLKSQDPEKEVLIQQGEDYDYMEVNSVTEKEVLMEDDWDESHKVVVIQYT